MRRTIAAMLAAATAGGAALLIAGCSGGSSAGTVLGSVPTPAAVATLPPPPVPTSSPFSATQSQIITVPAPTASGTPAPVTVPVPAAGGFSGGVTLPLAQATIPPNTAISQVAGNVEPAGLPPLSTKRSIRDAATGAAGATILYDTLTFSNTTAFASQPSFSFAVPQAYVLSGVQYWMASYNPLYPSLGWQRAFEGPGVVSGTTIAFTGAPTPYVFFANEPVSFALYALAAQAPAPTPAPAATPAPLPPAISAAPSFVTFTSAADPAATVTIGDASTTYSGAYTVTVGDATVATATISGKTVTIVPAGAGQTLVTVSSTDARRVTIPVGVTTTTTNVQ